MAVKEIKQRKEEFRKLELKKQAKLIKLGEKYNLPWTTSFTFKEDM